MRYVDPNQPGSKVEFKAQYENFIGGEWVAPIKGEYFVFECHLVCKPCFQAGWSTDNRPYDVTGSGFQHVLQANFFFSHRLAF